MATATDEHRVGALLLAVASASVGNYVLIRSGLNPSPARGRHWRVNVRRAGREQVTTSAESLAAALERALDRLRPYRHQED